MKRFLFAVFAAAVCLSACTETKDILYRGSMFGTMQDTGVMLGDDGCTYHFTNLAKLSPAMPSEGRVVATFDVFSLIEGTKTEYEAEVLYYEVPVCKDPVVCNDAMEEAELGTDPVEMQDGSYMAGYLNLLCAAMLRYDSEVVHRINLQVVPGENADTLHTILRHNAGEDKVTEDNSGLYSETPFYACFPLGDYLPDGKSVVLEIKWFWKDEWQYAYGKISK